MIEPLYEFVKGKGWVLKLAPSLTKRVGNCNVTLESRKPEPGEHYFQGNYIATMGYLLADPWWIEIFSTADERIRQNISKCVNRARLTAREYAVVTWTWV